MRKIVALVVAGALLGGCTLTNSAGQPVVLTRSNAPALIIAQMKKGCASLMANQALVDMAVAKASQALQDTSGVIAEVSNAASIGCSLLVPPPPLAGPAG